MKDNVQSKHSDLNSNIIGKDEVAYDVFGALVFMLKKGLVDSEYVEELLLKKKT